MKDLKSPSQKGWNRVSLLIFIIVVLAMTVTAIEIAQDFPTDGINASAFAGYNGGTNQSFNGTAPQFHCFAQSTATNETRNVSLFLSRDPLPTSSAIRNATQDVSYVGGAGGVIFFNLSNMTEGLHFWFCEVQDNSTPFVANTTVNRSITIDKSGPAFRFVSSNTPSTDQVFTAGVNISDTYTQPHTVRLFANVSGASNNEINVTDFILNNGTVNLSYGVPSNLVGETLNFSFYVNDTVNNHNITLIGIFSVNDATPPGPIELLLPTNGALHGGQFLNFSFNATDNSGIQMTCDINISQGGSIVQSIEGIEAQSLANTTNETITALSSGFYSWSVNCTDFQLNVNTSLARTFTIDSTGPAFANVSSSGTASTDTNFTAGVEIRDPLAPISSVRLIANISGDATNVVEATFSATNQTSVNLSFIVPRNLTGHILNISFEANDSLNNVNTTEIGIFTVSDATPPGPIVLIQPIGNEIQRGQQVNLTFNASDNTQAFRCDINISQGGSIVQSITSINVTSATNQSNQTISALASGGYYWSVNCTDSARNVNTSTMEHFVMDSDGPGFENVSNSGSLQTGVNFTAGTQIIDAFSSLTNVQLAVNISGDNSNIVETITTPTNNSLVNLSFIVGENLTGQILNVSIRSTDSTGNENRTTLGIFTVSDATPPGPIILVDPADDYNQSQTILNLTFNASDNTQAFSCDINISQGGNIIQSIAGINVTSATNQTNLTIAALSTGGYAWSVNCTDNALNTNTSLSRNFVIDNQGPGFFDVSNSGTASTQTNFTVGLNITDTFTRLSSVHLIVNVSGTANNIVDSSFAVSNRSLVNLSYIVAGNLTGHVLNISVLANDSFNNQNTTEVGIFTVQDALAPGPIRLVAPADLFNQTSPTVSFTINATDNTQAFTCAVNISQGGSIVQSLYPINVTSDVNRVNSSAPLANGTYQWSVNCTDSALNANTSDAREFTIDNEKPAFFNVSISHNTIGSGDTIYLAAVWNDTFTQVVDAVLYVNLSGNSDNIVAFVPNINESARVNISYTIPGGSVNQVYNFTMSVNDSVQNSNSTIGRIVTVVDNTPPGPMFLVAPADNANISNSTPPLTFNATDGSGSLTCVINLSQSGSSVSIIENIEVISAVDQTNTTPLANGTYQWSVNCSDSIGNFNTTSARTFTVDTEQPAFYNVSISHTTIGSGGTVYLAAVWNDTFTTVEDAALYVNVSGNSNNIVDSSTSITDNLRVNLSYTIPGGSVNQVYNFTMTVNDSAENSNITAAFIVTITDNTPPLLVLNTPQDLFNFSTATATLNFTTTDLSSTTLTCDINVSQSGAIVQSVEGIEATSGVHQVNTTVLANGTYNWGVNCTDSAGNHNTSSARSFTVDTEQPAAINVSISHTTAGTGTVVHLYAFWNDTYTELDGAQLLVNISGASDNVVNSTSTNLGKGSTINLSYTIISGADTGTYNFTLRVNDTVGNSNITVAQLVTSTDTQVPTITPVIPDATRSTEPVASFIPNITVSSDTSTCKYSINNTGTTANVTMALSGTTCIGSLTTLRNLTAGTYNITFYAIDSSNNEGSLVYYINISDITAPQVPNDNTISESVSTSTATITVTNNETVTANVSYGTSSGSLTSTSFESDYSTSQAVSLSGLSSGTQYFYNVSVCDSAGNCASNGTFTFTTSSSSTSSSSSSSSGGGGGGGGGSSVGGAITKVKLPSQTQIWNSIPSGSTTTMTIKDPETAITSIVLEGANKDLSKVEIKVSRQTAKPILTEPTDHVYQYLELTKRNVDAEDVDAFEIFFDVPQSWLVQEGLTSADVSLYRLTTQWDELETTLLEEDSTSASYKALTPDFSFFAVAAKASSVPVRPPSEPEVPEAPPTTPTEPEPEPQPEEESDDVPLLNVKTIFGVDFEWLLVGLLAVLLVTFFWYDRNKMNTVNKSKKKKVMVYFHYDVPRFTGPDGKRYGPFYAKQRIKLPRQIADDLLDQNFVDHIQE